MTGPTSDLDEIELRYLGDKQKREVNFLVVKNHKPWFLLEVKRSDTSLSPSFAHFQAQIQAAHAFQLVVSLACQPADCFRVHRPVVVPAWTFPEPTALSTQAAARRTEKSHRLMAHGDRRRPPGRTTCLRPRISFALLF